MALLLTLLKLLSLPPLVLKPQPNPSPSLPASLSPVFLGLMLLSLATLAFLSSGVKSLIPGTFSNTADVSLCWRAGGSQSLVLRRPRMKRVHFLWRQTLCHCSIISLHPSLSWIDPCSSFACSSFPQTRPVHGCSLFFPLPLPYSAHLGSRDSGVAILLSFLAARRGLSVCPRHPLSYRGREREQISCLS